MTEHVYIMTSRQRPDICKVGRTSNTPSHRCDQLNRGEYLCVTDWKVAYSRKVDNSHSAEKRVHDRLARYRLNLKKHREAFDVDLEEAKRAVDSVCGNKSYCGANDTVEVSSAVEAWTMLMSVIIMLGIFVVPFIVAYIAGFDAMVVYIKYGILATIFGGGMVSGLGTFVIWSLEEREHDRRPTASKVKHPPAPLKWENGTKLY